MSAAFFQDYIRNNHCFGCAPGNPHGFRIKSAWQAPGESVCRFTPREFHCSASPDIVHGGVIASLIDCHCVCTAIADAYRRDGRNIGEGTEIMYVTAALNVSYKKPTPLGPTLTLTAVIEETTPKKTVLRCTVHIDDAVYVEADVTAVRVTRE